MLYCLLYEQNIIQHISNLIVEREMDNGSSDGSTSLIREALIYGCWRTYTTDRIVFDSPVSQLKTSILFFNYAKPYVPMKFSSCKRNHLLGPCDTQHE